MHNSVSLPGFLCPLGVFSLVHAPRLLISNCAQATSLFGASAIRGDGTIGAFGQAKARPDLGLGLLSCFFLKIAAKSMYGIIHFIALCD